MLKLFFNVATSHGNYFILLGILDHYRHIICILLNSNMLININSERNLRSRNESSLIEHGETEARKSTLIIYSTCYFFIKLYGTEAL